MHVGRPGQVRSTPPASACRSLLAEHRLFKESLENGTTVGRAKRPCPRSRFLLPAVPYEPSRPPPPRSRSVRAGGVRAYFSAKSHVQSSSPSMDLRAGGARARQRYTRGRPAQKPCASCTLDRKVSALGCPAASSRGIRAGSSTAVKGQVSVQSSPKHAAARLACLQRRAHKMRVPPAFPRPRARARARAVVAPRSPLCRARALRLLQCSQRAGANTSLVSERKPCGETYCGTRRSCHGWCTPCRRPERGKQTSCHGWTETVKAWQS